MSDRAQWWGVHRRAVGVGAAALAVLALAVVAAGRLLPDKAQQTAAEEKVYPVRVIETASSQNQITLRYTGLVQPQELVQCMAETVSTIEELYVKEGDVVRKGQPIARLDVSKAQEQAANTASAAEGAKSSLDAAQRARDQAQKDYDQACQKAPAQELAEARAKRDAAKAQRDRDQVEVERIQAALEPWKQKVEEAQSAYDAKQAATEEKQAAAEQAARSREEKEAACKALEEAGDTTSPEYAAARQAAQQAKAEQDQADQALAAAKAQREAQQALLTQAQSELAAQKAAQGQAGAEAALTASQTLLDARQAEVDWLEAQGEGSELAKAQRQRLEAADAALLQARSLHDMAQRTHSSAQKTAGQDQLLANASGHIIKLMGAEGGLASPLAPVAVIASHEAVVQFEASQDDVRQLQQGTEAVVTLDGREYPGQVTSIGLLPDEATRTYPVSVSVQGGEELFLGSMAQVELNLGQRSGVWLPLTVILNDGQDYVYLVEQGHALRRDVEITEVSGDQVLVNGLENGCQIICEGMKTVHSGSAVKLAGTQQEQSGDDAA